MGKPIFITKRQKPKMSQIPLSDKAQFYKCLSSLTKRMADEDTFWKTELNKRCKIELSAIKTPFIAKMIEPQLKETKKKLSEIENYGAEKLEIKAHTRFSEYLQTVTESNVSFTKEATEVKVTLKSKPSFEEELLKEEYGKFQVKMKEFVDAIHNEFLIRKDNMIKNLIESNPVGKLVLQKELSFVQKDVESAIRIADRAIDLIRIDENEISEWFEVTKEEFDYIQNDLSKIHKELNQCYVTPKIPLKSQKMDVDINLDELKFKTEEKKKFEKLKKRQN